MKQKARTYHLVRLVVPVLVLAGSAACNSGGCYDNQSAIPLAEFRDSGTGNTMSLRGLRISGVGAPGDSAIVSPDQTLSQVYLPMRSTMSSTSWCMHYTQAGLDDDAFNDTVTFGYTSRPFFASDECGAMYVYDITSVGYTTHLVDSVVVLDSLVTNVDIPRIAIYFRTVSEEPENPEDPENPETPDNPGDTGNSDNPENTDSPAAEGGDE